MAGSEGPAPGPDPADPAPPTAATDDDGLACAICLLPLPPDAPDVAHVDCPAWHRLHAACARRWTVAQLASSRGGPPRLRCPLCSRPYASLVLPCGDSGAVVEAEFDALAEDIRELVPDIGRNVFANDVAAEGQRKPGGFFPPGTEIAHKRKTVARVGELALVDDQAGVRAPAPHRIEYFIEWHDDMPEIGAKIELSR